jgi:5-formyltetrahydrofolate cyclo-ligase
MPSVAMEETRNELRSAALKRRAALDPATCYSWSRLIQAKTLGLSQYRTVRSVAVYYAIGNEVDTCAIVDHALGNNKKVFVSKLGTGEPGVFVRISSREEQGKMAAARATSASALDWTGPEGDELMVIVPGVLFDGQGNRLGRGGGWYDRTLQLIGGRGLYVGLAYELQLIDRVPAQPWDQRVDYVITESRVIDCSAQLPERIAR